MDHSFRYTARDFTAELPAAAYVARFRDAERVGGYCRECGNYGRSWGCPPFGFDMEEYVTRYGTALLVATRITPEEPGRRSGAPDPARTAAARTSAAGDGTAIRRTLVRLRRNVHSLSRGELHAPRRQALPPSGTGAAVARSLRIRRGTHGLRTVRNRDEVGQRRPHARVPDARMRIFPRRGIGRMERIWAVFNRSGGKDSAHAPLRAVRSGAYEIIAC